MMTNPNVETATTTHEAWVAAWDAEYPGWDVPADRFLSAWDFPAGTPVYVEEVTADDIAHYGPRY